MLKENQLQAAKIGPLEGKIQTGVDVKEEIQKNRRLRCFLSVSEL